MKAAILTGNARIELGSLPEGNLGRDECRIAIKAAGVCSSDVPRAFGGGAYFYPLVMGHELAGEIIEVGSDVSNRRIGDRVTVFPLLPCFACPSCDAKQYARCANYDYYGSRRHGGFAERLAVKNWNLLAVPSTVTLDDAALTEPTSVVVHALRRSGLLSLEQGNAEFVGKHALILGAGFLGQIAARILARHCPGLVVHVCDRNRHKIELVRPFVASADVVSDDVEMATFKARHASGFHYVFEAAGTPQSYLNSVELAAPGGVVVWIGNISDDLTLQKKTVSSILRKELNVLGAWNSSYDGAAPSDWTAALDLMSSSLHLSSLVSHRIGLDDLPAALRKMDAHLRRTERHEIVKVLVGS